MVRLDVEAVVKDKLGARTPQFVINYLKRIVHEDTFNSFFAAHPDLKDYDFIHEVTFNLLRTTVSVCGKDNIPTTPNPLLFVSNHPLGGLDGMILAYTLGEQRQWNVRVIVNELLMNLKPLEGIFIPVKVGGGKQDRAYVKQLDDIYASQYDILTFPSGKCSRKIDGKIQDPEWKKSFVQKAIQHQRDILPIRFDGQNSRFFYNLALWRQRLGIKTNIEMLYLADEMFRQEGNHFTVNIGTPIPYTSLTNTHTPQQWAALIREQVYQIGK